MKEFDIYRHAPDEATEAVKRGFSWPGFLFNWIWALVKGLWLQACAFFIIMPLLVIGQVVFEQAQNPVGALTMLLLQLAVFISYGVKGNEWRRRALEKRGYEHVALLEAESATTAMVHAASIAKGTES